MKTVYEKLAALNPFRYRGYVWDSETGLYYLRSRYYCPARGRFINADTRIELFKLGRENQFQYCKNGPATRRDEDGKSFKDLWKDLIDTIKPLGYSYYGWVNLIDTGKRMWDARMTRAEELRKENNISSKSTVTVSVGLKQVTTEDRRAQSLIEGVFTGLLGYKLGKLGATVGFLLGVRLGSENTPDTGYYLCVTYTYTRDYYVIGGDYEDHKGMECEKYTETWIVEEYTNGVNTYVDVTLEDINACRYAVGIYADECPLHS